MNLLTSIAAAGRVVRDKVSQAARRAAELARRSGLGSEVARVEDAAALIRNAVTEGVARARDAAADALAKSGAGLGAVAAARVGSRNNVYRRALSLFDSPAKRAAWIVVAVVVALIVAGALYSRVRKR